MKQLIILTGPSGVGKSHMMTYARDNIAGVDSLDTGDLFKALYAHAYYGYPYVAKVLTGNDALWYFMDNHLREGIRLYEKAKKSGEITGHQIINFIEVLRSLCPDLPARSIRAYADLHPDLDYLFTTAIDETELFHLCELGFQVQVIALHCKNPVKRDGDNRSPVGRSYIDLALSYSLEASHTIPARILALLP